MADEFYWSTGANTIKMRGTVTAISSQEQVLPGSRVNASEIDRNTQSGQQKIAISDFSNGMTKFKGIGNVRPEFGDINRVAYNQGIVTRIPRLAYVPYNPTVQATLTNEEDIQGFVAANKRLHTQLSSNGDTALRYFVGLGKNVITDTSSSNPAVIRRNAATNDYITASGRLYLNSTEYAGLAFRNTADAVGVVGYTDVSGSGAMSNTALVALGTASDTIWHMQYMSGLGPTGCNVFIGSVGGVNQVWYATGSATIPATLQPVVDTSSKDIEGTLTVATTAAQLPTSAWQEIPVGTTTGYPYDVGWAGLTNLGSSNNAYATVALATGGVNFSYPLRVDYGGQFALAKNVIVKGIQVAVEGHEAAANNDTTFHQLTLTVNGQDTGIDRADTDTYELNATTDTTTTFGTTTDSFGVALTGADLQAIGVRMELHGGGGVNNGTASIDTITMAITYRPPGTVIKINQGGCGLNPMPNFPNRMVGLEPVADDATSIVKPRRLYYLDFEWDNEGNRPTATKSYPDVGGLQYVWHGVPFAGGYAVTGGASAGPGKLLMLLKDDGKVINYRFPGFHGGLLVSINSLFTLNGYLGQQVVNTDYSDLQYWFLDIDRNQFYADTPLSSLLATGIALQPIPYAETTLNLQQNIIYSWYPATTHTAIRREYIPADLNVDPRTDTTNTKFASAIFLQSMEMVAGYAEATNSVLRAEYQERAIGTATSATGTVKLEIELGGDANWAAPAISTGAMTAGFNATPSSRGFYNVAGAKPYQTLMYRITLDQGSSTTTMGPNGLQWLITTAQQWPELRTWDIELEPDGHSHGGTVMSLLQGIFNLKLTQNAQPLKIGEAVAAGSNAPPLAAFDRVVGWRQRVETAGSAQGPAATVNVPTVRFRELPGASA